MFKKGKKKQGEKIGVDLGDLGDTENTDQSNQDGNKSLRDEVID